MTDDDQAVMKRLAALEAEVKADADAQRARKEAALAPRTGRGAGVSSADPRAAQREQRAKQQAEKAALSSRQAELVTKKKQPLLPSGDDDDTDDGIGSTLALAKRAHGVKQELTRPTKAGEKSWVKSGIASMLLGPLGWLYAGSFREAIPASAAWIAFGALATKLIPMFLLMPVLFVAMPLSGIAGVVYALQYNRKGGRQRLFDKSKAKPKELPGR